VYGSASHQDYEKHSLHNIALFKVVATIQLNSVFIKKIYESKCITLSLMLALKLFFLEHFQNLTAVIQSTKEQLLANLFE
jgi:hypothetical protein